MCIRKNYAVMYAFVRACSHVRMHAHRFSCTSFDILSSFQLRLLSDMELNLGPVALSAKECLCLVYCCLHGYFKTCINYS